MSNPFDYNPFGSQRPSSESPGVGDYMPVRDFFRAKLTAKTSVGGVWNYDWTEQTFDPITGLDTDANPARSGSYSGGVANSPALELNNAEIDLSGADVIVHLRQKGMVGGQMCYEFAYNLSSSALTVEEQDGSPSYPSTTTLLVHQADGFYLQQPVSGQALVRLTPATATQAGGVSTSDQTWGGVKTSTGFQVTQTGDYVQLNGWNFTSVGPLLGLNDNNACAWLFDPANFRIILYGQKYAFSQIGDLTGTVVDGASGTLGPGATSTGGIITNLGSGSFLAFTTISVSGQSDVVADSITDTLTMAAGTGLAITTDPSTDTITFALSATYAEDAFKTISVSGQSDVVADTPSDVLTLVAGTGIAITTTAGTDTVTFALSSPTPGYTKYTKVYGDFSDPSTSKTLSLFTMAAGSTVAAVVIKHSVEFTAPGMTFATAEVGVTGNNGQFIAGLDVKQTVSDTAFSTAPLSPGYYNFAGIGVTVTLTTGGANLNTLTGGSLDVWVLYTPLP